MDSEELKKRTMEFALRILKLVGALPNTPEAQVIKLIILAKLLKLKLVEPLLQEAIELTAIMGASRKTASRRRRQS